MESTDPRILPGYDHPNFPRDEDNPVACGGCFGEGCKECGFSGSIPAWCYSAEITGTEHPIPAYLPEFAALAARPTD